MSDSNNTLLSNPILCSLYYVLPHSSLLCLGLVVVWCCSDEGSGCQKRKDVQILHSHSNSVHIYLILLHTTPYTVVIK